MVALPVSRLLNRTAMNQELSSTMVVPHLLAAPDRIVSDLVPILKEHGITCEVEHTKKCDHSGHELELTSLFCVNGETQVYMGIEKRSGRNGVDIVLAPACRSFFHRHDDSEKLVERIAEILCRHGATEEPYARCEDLE